MGIENGPKFISIGKELSFNYDIQVGDKVLIMFPQGVETIIGNLPDKKPLL